MKITYISGSVIPSYTANSIHVIKMCHAFSCNGHETILYALRPSKFFDCNRIYEIYGIENNFKIKCFKRIKIPFYDYLFGLIVAIEASFSKQEIVISRHPAGCFFSTLFRLKTVFETHSPIKESGKLTGFLFSIMKYLPTFKKLIVITNTLKNYYLEMYPDLSNDDILVLPDAADIIDFNNIKPKGIRINNKLNLGYTGHLYNGKGMEIISKLVDIKPDWYFHIVGGNEKDIDFWKVQLQNTINIKFYGMINHSDVASYLLDFDIVLLPNQHDVNSNAGNNIGNWTSPLKLFEYMATGKAIIASDLPVLREILINNENAILCDPFKIEEWIAAIDHLSNNSMLKNTIANNALKDFKCKYTWLARTRKILQYCHD